MPFLSKHDMSYRVEEERNKHMKLTKSWSNFKELLDQKFIILAPFCGDIDCESMIKKDSTAEDKTDIKAPSMGSKTLCIPLEQVSSSLLKYFFYVPWTKQTRSRVEV